MARERVYMYFIHEIPPCTESITISQTSIYLKYQSDIKLTILHHQSCHTLLITSDMQPYNIQL